MSLETHSKRSARWLERKARRGGAFDAIFALPAVFGAECRHTPGRGDGPPASGAWPAICGPRERYARDRGDHAARTKGWRAGIRAVGHPDRLEGLVRRADGDPRALPLRGRTPRTFGFRRA